MVSVYNIYRGIVLEDIQYYSYITIFFSTLTK